MTNQLTLRSIDIPSIHKFSVGFDRMFDELTRNQAQQTNYPPYNIVQINEDEYMISLAVAGFGPDNLSVTKEKNFLIFFINNLKIKSMNILKDPANMGGKDVFKASLFTGYELPKINIINKSNILSLT